MTKKIIIVSLFAFIGFGFWFAQNLWALEDRSIASASELDYPPFSVVTENGEADGFSVELLRETLKAMDLEVSFYVAPWSQVKQDLADGKIQVLPLVGRTPEREPVYDFTFPYLTFFGAIFVREGDSDIRSLEDIKNKEVLVMKGDNAEEYARREAISNNIVAVETWGEAYRLLSEGQYDAVLNQEYSGLQILKNTGINNVVPIVKVNDFRQDFTFAVKEGDAELLSILNEGLSVVILNGTFDRIYDKWFAEEPEPKPFPEEEKSYLWFIIGISLVVIIPFVFWVIKKLLSTHRITKEK